MKSDKILTAFVVQHLKERLEAFPLRNILTHLRMFHFLVPFFFFFSPVTGRKEA